MVEKIIMAEMDKLSSEEREDFAEMAVLNRLLGSKCAVCGFEYKTKKDLQDHGILGGYETDVVGKKCWEEYLQKHQSNNSD